MAPLPRTAGFFTPMSVNPEGVQFQRVPFLTSRFVVTRASTWRRRRRNRRSDELTSNWPNSEVLTLERVRELGPYKNSSSLSRNLRSLGPFRFLQTYGEQLMILGMCREHGHDIHGKA